MQSKSLREGFASDRRVAHCGFEVLWVVSAVRRRKRSQGGIEADRRRIADTTTCTKPLVGLWGLVFGVLRGVPLARRLPGELARRRGTVGARVGLREQVICRSFRP